MAAENYHLKWDSHLSYLNSSIATLYKNEKFADVMLYSSYSNSGINSDIPTVGISAHKFILSSCSQFFATMFETAPITAPNGVLYIVLPPDLSHRAIQILVQYMYSGEATVSNDILNEVLRGGEILKIRGLCRTNASSGGSSVGGSVGNGHSHGHHLHQHQREPSALYVSNGTRSTLAPPPPPPMSTQLPGDIYSSSSSNKVTNSSSGSGTSSARYSMDHHHTHHQHPLQHHSQQFRGLGASVMPKDSPVIVKSPKIASHTGLLSVATTTSSNKMHPSNAVVGGGGGGGISVNKEVAIDPEDKCCYATSSQVDSLPQSSQVSAVPASAPQPQPPPPPPMSICTEVGCSSCPMAAASNEPTETSLRRPDYVEESLCERDRDDVGLVYERRLRRERSCERAPTHEYYAHDGPPHYEHVVKSYEVGPPAVAPRLNTPPHPHSFLTIKQEPTDWSTNPATSLGSDNHHEHSQDGPMSPKQPLDFKINTVKLEANSNAQDDSEEHTLRDYNNFKVLVCEICQKSFEDTKTLVRHLGTHASVEPTTNMMGGVGVSGAVTGGTTSTSSTSTNNNNNNNLALRALKTYVPKKRRRVSQQENNMDHVTLLCDLCSTSFETPAEWVRHMNSQHTEIELAMFNSKKDVEQKGHSNNSTSASSSVSQIQHTTVSSGASTTSTGLSTTVAHKKYFNPNSRSSNNGRVGAVGGGGGGGGAAGETSPSLVAHSSQA